MPDIAMCFGHGCPLRETCYRFKAKPTPGRQSYVVTPYIDGHCDLYWPMEET